MQYGIDCRFRRVDGYLFVDKGGDIQELEREYAAAQRAGLEVELLLEGISSLPSLGPVLRFAHQGRMDPAAYLHGG